MLKTPVAKRHLMDRPVFVRAFGLLGFVECEHSAERRVGSKCFRNRKNSSLRGVRRAAVNYALTQPSSASTLGIVRVEPCSSMSLRRLKSLKVRVTLSRVVPTNSAISS